MNPLFKFNFKTTVYDEDREVAIVIPKAKAQFLFGADTADGVLAAIAEMIECDLQEYAAFKKEYEG